MKGFYALIFLILSVFTLQAQTPCQLSLDDIYLDTAASDCNHLFFKYKISGGTATGFLWNYGDGNSCTCIHPKNAYNRNGNFDVCGRIQDANGCVDSLCKTFTVYCADPCHLSELGIFSMDSSSFTCSEFEFITITSSNTKKVRWDFGDGDTADSKYIVHDFKANGVYNVRLIINDSINCADTGNLQVTVDCPPSHFCDFILHLDTLPDIDSNTKSFRIRSNKPYNKLWWDFGDGISRYGDSTEAHTYINVPTTYTVCVYGYDSAGCEDTICVTIYVNLKDTSHSGLYRIIGQNLYSDLFIGSEQLKIQLKQSCQYELIDASAKRVLSGRLPEGQQIIEIRMLGTGLYTLLLKSNNQVIPIRIFKP